MHSYERVVAEIHLDAMAKNIQNIKKELNPNTELIAVVKADGYGHGALETATIALENGASMLGVAIFDEALQMRKHGITAPIIILGYTPQNRFFDVLENNIVLTVFSLETAYEISKTAVALNKTAQIHIKIDSGMGRIGFLPTQQSIDEIVSISNLDNVEIVGIYSHLASSEDLDTSYTFAQRDAFFEIIGKLKARGVPLPMLHISNSAALDIHELNYDAVRAGIVLYGLYPFKYRNLTIPLFPVMRLKSRISFLKELSSGSSIGYGRTYKTTGNQRIATIPVGYADGYMRAMSNSGRVLVGGEYAPIVGRICMDQFMVDVTHIENVSVGDEVVMIGEQNGKCITADEIASICQTISYEIICAIGKRVPRAYIKNNTTIKTLNYIDYV